MSNKKHSVVLYGDSLIVSSIAAGLQSAPEIEVTCLDAVGAMAAENLRALEPNVLVFDLAQISPEHRMTLLRECPGLTMIGLDFQSELAFVLSSRTLRALTVEDLVDVIRGQDAAGPKN